MSKRIPLFDLTIKMYNSEGKISANDNDTIKSIDTFDKLVGFLEKNGKTIFNCVATEIANALVYGVNAIRLTFSENNKIIGYEEYLELEEKINNRLSDCKLDSEFFIPKGSSFIDFAILSENYQDLIYSELKSGSFSKKKVSLENSRKPFISIETVVLPHKNKDYEDNPVTTKFYDKLARSIEFGKVPIVRDITIDNSKFNEMFDYGGFIKSIVSYIDTIDYDDVVEVIYEFVIKTISHITNYIHVNTSGFTELNNFYTIGMDFRIDNMLRKYIDTERLRSFSKENILNVSVSFA